MPSLASAAAEMRPINRGERRRTEGKKRRKTPRQFRRPVSPDTETGGSVTVRRKGKQNQRAMISILLLMGPAPCLTMREGAGIGVGWTQRF